MKWQPLHLTNQVFDGRIFPKIPKWHVVEFPNFPAGILLPTRDESFQPPNPNLLTCEARVTTVCSDTLANSAASSSPSTFRTTAGPALTWWMVGCVCDLHTKKKGTWKHFWGDMYFSKLEYMLGDVL